MMVSVVPAKFVAPLSSITNSSNVVKHQAAAKLAIHVLPIATALRACVETANVYGFVAPTAIANLQSDVKMSPSFLVFRPKGASPGRVEHVQVMQTVRLERSVRSTSIHKMGL
jgi:hypothetical protein